MLTATAGCSDQCHCFARGNFQIDLFQDLNIYDLAAVRKENVLFYATGVSSRAGYVKVTSFNSISPTTAAGFLPFFENAFILET